MNLGPQLGPLPLVGWVGVIGGGTVIGLYMRHRQGVAPAAIPAVGPTDATVSGMSGTRADLATGVGTAGADDGSILAAENLTASLGNLSTTVDGLGVRFDGIDTFDTATTLALGNISNRLDSIAGGVITPPAAPHRIDAPRPKYPTKKAPAVSKPAPAKPAPKPATVTYVVKRGDTLSKIALTHGTTVAKVAAANGISNPNLIRTGQVLHL